MTPEDSGHLCGRCCESAVRGCHRTYLCEMSNVFGQSKPGAVPIRREAYRCSIRVSDWSFCLWCARFLCIAEMHWSKSQREFPRFLFSGKRLKLTQHAAVLILSPLLASDVARDPQKYEDVILRSELARRQSTNTHKPPSVVEVISCPLKPGSESRQWKRGWRDLVSIKAGIYSRWPS